MNMMDLIPRAVLGLAIFVLVSAFALLASPVLLPLLAFLTGRPGKPTSPRSRVQPGLRKPESLTATV
jgi:hypothetical protein